MKRYNEKQLQDSLTPALFPVVTFIVVFVLLLERSLDSKKYDRTPLQGRVIVRVPRTWGPIRPGEAKGSAKNG